MPSFLAAAVTLPFVLDNHRLGREDVGDQARDVDSVDLAVRAALPWAPIDAAGQEESEHRPLPQGKA